jgi:triacylglycerol lipase
MNLVFSTGFLAPQMLGGQEYFRALPSKFPDALFPLVPIVGTIADRANAMASAIAGKNFPPGPIHIIAHSMGGLDSRFLISQDVGGLASSGRIGSLSTISTPHLGSAVADFVMAPKLDSIPERALYDTIVAVVHAMGMPTGALANLTTSFCKTFNAANPDRAGIKYFAYAGVGLSNFFLKPSHAYLQHVGKTPEEVQNDGMVTIASATHNGLTEPPWTGADHVTEVGWQIDRAGFKADFDHLAAIDRIIHRLSQ